jgi:hypothetical protein
MEIQLFTLLPEKPEDFLNFATAGLKIPQEDAFKLFFLTFKIKASRDTPIYEWLERTPSFIKFDEIAKNQFLLTLSIFTLRDLLVEHFDLKFTKNLYLSVKDLLPGSFLKGCLPKREVIVSQDLFFEVLSRKKINQLPPFLKVRHLILTFHFKGNCDDLLMLTPSLSFFVLRRIKEGLYEIFLPQSISEFVCLARDFTEKKFFKNIEMEALFYQLRSLFPECFGEI